MNYEDVTNYIDSLLQQPNTSDYYFALGFLSAMQTSNTLTDEDRLKLKQYQIEAPKE